MGFELELQVLLTSGKPLEPSETLEYPSTVEDLASSRLTRRPQVKETRHTVVLADGRVFEWQVDSMAPAGEGVIRPVDITEEKPGRWVQKQGGGEKDSTTIRC